MTIEKTEKQSSAQPSSKIAAAKKWCIGHAPELIEPFGLSSIFETPSSFDGARYSTGSKLNSLRDSLMQWGQLTPKQVNFAKLLLDRLSDKKPTFEKLPDTSIDHPEIYFQICEAIEAKPWCTTASLVRQFMTKKQQRFRSYLYALEALKAVRRIGKRSYKWRVEADWKAVLKRERTNTVVSPPPKSKTDADTVDTKEFEALKLQLIKARQELEAAEGGLKKKDEEKAELEQQVKLAKSKQALRIEVKKGKLIKKLKGRFHRQFAKVLQLANARKHVLLVGPAGCGKSFLGRQVKEALSLTRYGSINCSVGMSEGQLTGRLIPTGDAGKFEYTATQFVECYENGGVFLMDEIDAADPNVLIVLNTALANGVLPLPNRVEKPEAKRHEQFVFLAAANTYGKGADRQYVGRNELDEATLDRFRIGTIEMDYDDGVVDDEKPLLGTSHVPDWFREKMKDAEGIETDVCPDDTLRITFQWYRHRIRENRLERVVSTRFLQDAYDMMQKAEWTLEDCERQFFAGWSDDEIRLVRSSA